MEKSISIIGAGIAGLTTAISLKQKGFNPIIFESSATIKPVGAGLALAGNAMQALKQLGLLEEVVNRGQLTSIFEICDEKGKTITTTNISSLSEKYGVGNYTIHRAELHNILLSKIDSSRIFLNKKTVDIDTQGQKVIVKFEDGTTHETEQLIVAEGIHSVIRKKLIPNSVPRYAGYTCWRGVIDNPGLTIEMSTETWGKGKRFGIVPIGKNRIYWFACINAPKNSEKYKNYTIDDLKMEFKSFHHPINAILSNTKNSELIWSDIIDLEPIQQFAFDNIVLIGDSAHATTPNMGQGACQAIEDAIVLANQLGEIKNPPEAFKSFEKKRLKRTHMIVKRSEKIGKIGQLENPILLSLRNFMFRLIPSKIGEKQIEKLFKVDF